MENYPNYTVEELAQDDFFRQWIQHPTVETDVFWADFLAHHPEKQADVVSASALLKAVENVQVFPTLDQGDRMWAGIQRQLQEVEPIGQETESRIYRIGFWQPWMAAAAVLLILGFGWWFVTKPVTTDQPVAQIEWSSEAQKRLVEQVNKTTKPLTVHLADGSRLVLQPRSRVSYPQPFDPARREIHLEGESFFEVTKNPQQPFLVFTDKLVTQVVGTSFTIKAIPKTAQVSVAVRTGKVAVYTLKAFQQSQRNQQQHPGMFLLTPNQQAVFDVASERLTKRLVEEPVLLKEPKTSQYFVFENAPVHEVFHKLEQAYGVTIQYDSTAFGSCNLTAPLSNEPLFQKLDIICQTIGATYEVWDTRIIISGPGCPRK
ncbi:DUF4974 domain-containing protein [Spirosoma sp. HMF4905]|uniref:DUF4974 domain-containing protein n=1 Tax=Spirosoma arboris TaxID=2682092 RepID=A0A7K1S5S9_9BACT|nr:FecR family protein [Spirosoma arboris]MVM29006.1 DUF4974 domain-containing protein [Spirosoma arboris]